MYASGRPVLENAAINMMVLRDCTATGPKEILSVGLIRTSKVDYATTRRDFRSKQ